MFLKFQKTQKWRELYGSANGHTNYGVIHAETNRTRSSATSDRIHGITTCNEDESVLKEIN
jgi:hypothetical protein